MTKITDEIYAGSKHDAIPEIMRQAGVRSVLRLDVNTPLLHRLPTWEYGLSDGITGGKPNDDVIIREAVSSLEIAIEKYAPVLVHCAMGMNRTVCIISAYLVKSGRCKTIKEAIAKIERAGHRTYTHDVLRKQVARIYER